MMLMVPFLSFDFSLPDLRNRVNNFGDGMKGKQTASAEEVKEKREEEDQARETPC